MRHAESEHLCSHFQAAMRVLARPWNGLILATLAGKEPLRFSELRDRLPAVGDRMLSVRLKELEERDLVVRHVSAGPPVRVEYVLTDIGRQFQDVLMAMTQWGKRLNLGASARPTARVARKKASSHPR